MANPPSICRDAGLYSAVVRTRFIDDPSEARAVRYRDTSRTAHQSSVFHNCVGTPKGRFIEAGRPWRKGRRQLEC